MQTQLNVVATDDEVDQDLLNNNNDVIDDDYEIENSADEKSDDKSWENCQQCTEIQRKLPRSQHPFRKPMLWYVLPTIWFLFIMF